MDYTFLLPFFRCTLGSPVQAWTSLRLAELQHAGPLGCLQTTQCLLCSLLWRFLCSEILFTYCNKAEALVGQSCRISLGFVCALYTSADLQNVDIPQPCVCACTHVCFCLPSHVCGPSFLCQPVKASLFQNRQFKRGKWEIFALACKACWIEEFSSCSRAEFTEERDHE